MNARRGTLIAPVWHTAVVVLMLIGLAIAGAMNRGSTSLAAVASIAVFGILFGIVALKAGNLRACMIGTRGPISLRA